MPNKPTLLWLRQDLRLGDHPALVAAIARGAAVIPVYIWDPKADSSWPMGAASRWWLHQSLLALDQALRQRGSRLVRRQGASAAVLKKLAKECNAGAVFWSRCYEPAAIVRDTGIKTQLLADGLLAESFNAQLLFEPWRIKTQSGKPFQVFTPFWKACEASARVDEPLCAPTKIVGPDPWPASDELMTWKLEPTIPWDATMRRTWRPGEDAAQKLLADFLKRPVLSYPTDRDRPDLGGTSRLSPYLHFGEISPRQIWHAVQARVARGRDRGFLHAADVFLRELGWREFAYHLLFHFPQTPEKPLRPTFDKFVWRQDSPLLRAWQRGRTGYPLIDAGLRELWATGWMHNRVRMVVASFLVKDLLLSWTTGARWFWDTLVDSDLANNTLGWQWVAGCGADAAPYFRIFNPVTQGERFDPSGDYVRRWVPELARLPARWIQKPWEAPKEILEKAQVVLGKTYPQPIVDHAAARQRALLAYGHLRGTTSPR